MKLNTVSRYNNIAISLHWLLALLIIGMLAVGKFMVGLDDTDPLRFNLTQWHKTFGILILLLSVFRLLWRMTHRAPTHPEKAPAWERVAAGVSHVALYALLFIAPVTGWMLVSVSPLNIDTLLFNVVPWPHLPWLHNFADKASAVGRYEQYHEWATGAMIALLLLHVAGALKHHFVDKDDVLARMSPSAQAGTGKTMMGLFVALTLGISASVLGYAALNTSRNASANSMSAGNSAVSAEASIMGHPTIINFAESTVNARLDANRPDASSLTATVPTVAPTSINSQVQGSLTDPEWFDSENHPDATFTSSKISSTAESQFEVEGTLTIKGVTHAHRFTLTVSESDNRNIATGEFIVDRMAYQLGLESQPTDEIVGKDVKIAFEFELLSPP